MEGKSNMKFYGELFSVFLLLVLGGCAPYKLEPLTLNHPANPEALAAPERLPSKPLAYSKAHLSPEVKHFELVIKDIAGVKERNIPLDS